MSTKKIIEPHGQSLVFFIVISLAVMAFIAVIIDGSNIYAMRRLAQNAADAGALAGARQLCYTQNSSIAIATAEQYAENNNFARLPTTISQNATASVSGSRYVDVVVDFQYSTFFAQAIGIDQLTAVANAQAGCFPPSAAEGDSVVPIAWKCPNLGDVSLPDGTIQKFCDLNANEPPDNICNLGDTDPDSDDLIYIFFDFDPDKPADQIWCKQWGAAPPGAIEIECSIDSDAAIDIWPISPLRNDHKWYWFNTDGGACGSSEEINIIEFGLKVPLYPHTWYPGCTGDRVSVFDAIADHREGETVLMPVFDPQCTGAELLANDPKCSIHPNAVSPKIDTILEPTYNGDHFHLWSFGAFRISCVDAGGNKCNDKTTDARAALLDANKGVSGLKLSDQNSVEGCFINDFVAGMSGDPNGVVTGAWVVYLTK